MRLQQGSEKKPRSARCTRRARQSRGWPGRSARRRRRRPAPTTSGDPGGMKGSSTTAHSASLGTAVSVVCCRAGGGQGCTSFGVTVAVLIEKRFMYCSTLRLTSHDTYKISLRVCPSSHAHAQRTSPPPPSARKIFPSPPQRDIVADGRLHAHFLMAYSFCQRSVAVITGPRAEASRSTSCRTPPCFACRLGPLAPSVQVSKNGGARRGGRRQRRR